ncbi:PilZ domain-containing protein [Sphingomonas piscis]|uniref:PilZ domain-containing protein n=1 Tax=Sphingomonas piscis TaxID=2714943 RepID=UPI001FE7A367|nr:PilZ domain-containing protein [Sphingomonas piscis]
MIATRTVELGDVSATGARLHGQDLPKVGDELFLRIRKVETFGRVVWREGDCAGVAFDEPLTASELNVVRSEGARTSQMRLTPAEVDALDQWVVGSR